MNIVLGLEGISEPYKRVGVDWFNDLVSSVFFGECWQLRINSKLIKARSRHSNIKVKGVCHPYKLY